MTKENKNVVDPTINAISLCSGIGMLDEGVACALEHFGIKHRTVAYAEWEGYPAQQLVSLMETGAMDPAPVWCGDFADLDWKAFHGVVDAFVAGYPCQAWSSAGKRLGFADKRWVWGHIEHGLSIVRPRFVYLENVRGLISGGGLGATIAGLSRLGYDTEWSTLYASSVGASHQRDRIFIFGFMADGDGKLKRSEAQQRRASITGRSSSPAQGKRIVAHDTGIGRLAKLAARQQSNAGVRSQGMVDSDSELHGTRHRNQLQPRSAADAGDQVQYRERAAHKPEGKAGGKIRTKAGEPVNWSEKLLFAPGQNDSRWDQIIRERPDLAPTIERDVRSLVDGLAPVLDQRIDANDKTGSRRLARKASEARINALLIERERMLRCAGNGVVPQQAAVAYIELMKRVGISK